MNYRNYKKGYSALRRIINDDELEFSRQFGKFSFSFSERYQENRVMRGIYNAKTNNVVAFINARGNVFIRPNSIYATPLIYGSKNKVIKNDNLRAIRSHVSGHVKRYALANMFGENAADRLIENKDEPNKVFLGKVNDNSEIDIRFFTKVLETRLDKKKFKNSLYAIKEGDLVVERRPEDQAVNQHRVYLNVQDYSEAIAQQEKIDKVKQEIAVAFVSNVREIAQDSILTGSSMNPLQFTYTMDGEQFTGRIKLNRMDMAYPPDMPITEWLKPQDLVRYIEFTERVGSLAERGIDEMANREDNNLNELRQRMTNRMYNEYVDYLRVNPGGTIRVPRMNDAVWHTDGDGVYSANYEQEYTEVSRADLEAMAVMPEMTVDPNMFWGDPEEVTPMTSA